METKSQLQVVAPTANQSSPVEIVPPHSTDQGPGKGVSTSQTRGSTGPRTHQGKDRSKHNALRHGVFSKVAVLKNESQAEFDALLKGLREDRKPRGAVEELLVEKIAVLFWRFRRFLSAEGAELRSGSEFDQWNKAESCREQAATLPQVTCNGGLVRWISNPEALQGCLDRLHDLERAIKANGFDPDYDRTILAKLYGNNHEDRDNWKTTLFKDYVDWYDTSLCEEQEGKEKGYATPNQCKENFLDGLKEEIRRLERYRKEHAAISARRLEVEAVRLPEMDRLLRYETSISREIDRTLNQLERLQRMRLGQPVPPSINLNVTSTKE